MARETTRIVATDCGSTTTKAILIERSPTRSNGPSRTSVAPGAMRDFLAALGESQARGA